MIPLTHEVEAADGLTKDLYDVLLELRGGAIVLTLRRVLRGVRPSRRHRWTLTRTWERHTTEPPPIPAPVRAALRKLLIDMAADAADHAT